MTFLPDEIELPPRGMMRCFVCGKPTTYRVPPKGLLLRIVATILLHPRGLPVCTDCLKRIAKRGKR